MREAFAKAVRDKELLDEAKKAKIDFGYIPPEEILKTFSGLLEQPADLQREMAKYIKFGS